MPGAFLLILTLTLGSWMQVAPTEPGAPLPTILLGTDAPAYEQGSTVSFMVAADNRTAAPITLSFRSAQHFDIVVADGEREVWRWAADRDFADAESEVLLPPGVTVLGRVSWDWRDARGVLLPPGEYRARASLTTDPARQGNVVLIPLGTLPPNAKRPADAGLPQVDCCRATDALRRSD